MNGNEDNNSSAVACGYRNGIDEIGNNNGIIMPLKHSNNNIDQQG